MTMTSFARLRSLLRNVFRRERVERELDDEVRAYSEQLADEKIAGGMNPERARREARLELGGSEQVKEEVRSTRSGAALDSLWQDVRFGARMLRRNPGFTAVAVLTLALGIGASTAIFAVVEAVLLRPLHYPHPERVVAIWESRLDDPAARARVTPADYMDLEAQTTGSFDAIAAFGASAVVLTGEGEPVQLLGVSATPSYFHVLGVEPLRGRVFTEGQAAQGERVLVISYELWNGRFAGDENIIGRTLRLDGNMFTVIGVMPPGLYPGWPATRGIILFGRSYHDYWVPRRFTPEMAQNRRSHVLGVIARRKADVTPQLAQADLDRIAAQLAATHATKAGEGLAGPPLMDEIVGGVRRALWFLFGAGALLLLIASANAAGLILARLISRKREIAMREALGAPRRRLVRQFFVEGLLLGLLAATAAVVMAGPGLALLLRLAPDGLPRMENIGVNATALGFAALATVFTSLVYALWPVWLATGADPARTLREHVTNLSAGRRLVWSRHAVVVAQVSLAMPLLVGAGLLMESFRQLLRVEPGFRSDNVLVADISLPSSYSEWGRVRGFYDQLIREVEALPGVEAASTAYDHPMRTAWIDSFSIEAETERNPDLPYSEAFRPIRPGYFRLLGIPLLRGRDFTEADEIGRQGVVIINESFVRRYFGAADPIGRRMRMTTPARIWPGASPESYEIVGIVADVRSAGLTAPPEPAFYLPSRQIPLGEATLLVRTAGDPLDMMAAVRGAVAAVDPEMPLQNPTTLERILAGQRAQQRFSMLLMDVFSALALTLVLVGLYGLLSYTVALRTQEIGIRLALGAQRGEILRMMMSHGLRPVLVGTAIGIILALAGTRLVSSLLFGVSPLDPAVFAATLLLLLAAAAVATLVPARRASRIDPMRALRYE